MARRYLEQTWDNYNISLGYQANVAVGGVVTKERLNHMEKGIAKACNTDIDITIVPGKEDVTSVTEDKYGMHIEVTSSEIEPKQGELVIKIVPSLTDSTSVVEKDGKRIITIASSALEPKQLPLDVLLLPTPDMNYTKIEENVKDQKKYVTVYSKFLNQLAFKAREEDRMIDIEDWTGAVAPYEVIIESEYILPSTVVRITKGDEITDEQLKMIHECGIEVVESLDGTFKLVARKKRPTMDFPIHITVI